MSGFIKVWFISCLVIVLALCLPVAFFSFVNLDASMMLVAFDSLMQGGILRAIVGIGFIFSLVINMLSGLRL